MYARVCYKKGGDNHVGTHGDSGSRIGSPVYQAD